MISANKLRWLQRCLYCVHVLKNCCRSFRMATNSRAPKNCSLKMQMQLIKCEICPNEQRTKQVSGIMHVFQQGRQSVIRVNFECGRRAYKCFPYAIIFNVITKRDLIRMGFAHIKLIILRSFYYARIFKFAETIITLNSLTQLLY